MKGKYDIPVYAIRDLDEHPIFVAHEDYSTLESQNAKLLAAIKKIHKFTDLEMRDGDSARELSAAILLELGEL
jgi:hypothetical protein